MELRGVKNLYGFVPVQVKNFYHFYLSKDIGGLQYILPYR